MKTGKRGPQDFKRLYGEDTLESAAFDFGEACRYNVGVKSEHTR